MILSNSEKDITLGEKISFGLGDFAMNGLFTFVSSYLMYFYTDYAKISLGLVSAILVVGRMVDAVSSVAVGAAVDRSKNPLGKCRPFLMKATIPLCIMLVCLFFVPSSWSDVGKSVYACAAYILFSVLYAGANVPYSTMLSVMTDNYRERISFNLFKNVGSGVGAVLVTAISLSVVQTLGGVQGNGFTKAAFLFAVVFCITALFSVFKTRERVVVTAKQRADRTSAAHSMLHNKPYLIFCAVQFMQMLYMIVHNQSTVYYAKCYLKNEATGSVLLTLTPFACIVVAMILPSMVRKLGMKYVVMMGNGLVAISMAGTIFAGDSIPAVIAWAVVTSLGWGFATGMIYVIVAQTIDYARKKDGIYLQGIMTSLVNFLMKAGVAVAGFVGPWILKLGGYQADAAATVRSLAAIRVNFIYIPLVLALIQVVLMSFFSLEECKEARNS